MGQKQNHPFQPSFNTSLRSDGGLLPAVVRELDERLGLGALVTA